MTNRRFVRLFRVLVVGGLLLGAGAASAVVIQNGRPDATAADQKLFEQVKAYLEQRLGDCDRCQLMVVIQNNHVRLSGVATKGSLPHLKKLKGSVPGVRSVNLDQVQFNPEPHPRPLREAPFGK